MSRAYIVDYHLLDRKDEHGRNLCRCCWAVVPKGRKKFYCSDECRDKVFEKYEWGYIRERVLKRDNYTCQFRGVNKKTDELFMCDYSEKKHQLPSSLAIHHIISVNHMRHLLWEMCYRDNVIKKDAMGLLFMNMFVEESNLITYCRDHHILIHKKGFNYIKAVKTIEGDYSRFLREFRAFLKLNYRERTQKNLDLFF